MSFKTEAIGDVQQWQHFPRVTGKRVIFALGWSEFPHECGFFPLMQTTHMSKEGGSNKTEEILIFVFPPLWNTRYSLWHKKYVIGSIRGRIGRFVANTPCNHNKLWPLLHWWGQRQKGSQHKVSEKNKQICDHYIAIHHEEVWWCIYRWFFVHFPFSLKEQFSKPSWLRATHKTWPNWTADQYRMQQPNYARRFHIHRSEHSHCILTSSHFH